jgi:hypothetical protein
MRGAGCNEGASLCCVSLHSPTHTRDRDGRNRERVGRAFAIQKYIISSNEVSARWRVFGAKPFASQIITAIHTTAISRASGAESANSAVRRWNIARLCGCRIGDCYRLFSSGLALSRVFVDRNRSSLHYLYCKGVWKLCHRNSVCLTDSSSPQYLINALMPGTMLLFFWFAQANICLALEPLLATIYAS